MNDSLKLLVVFALIPVLMFSMFGFVATFQATAVEEGAGVGRLMQRMCCGMLVVCCLAAMARLASHRKVTFARDSRPGATGG
jgi:hypothetical protein